MSRQLLAQAVKAAPLGWGRRTNTSRQASACAWLRWCMASSLRWSSSLPARSLRIFSCPLVRPHFAASAAGGTERLAGRRRRPHATRATDRTTAEAVVESNSQRWPDDGENGAKQIDRPRNERSGPDLQIWTICRRGKQLGRDVSASIGAGFIGVGWIGNA